MDIDFKPHKPDRIPRVNELIKEELAPLVQKETQGKFVTITEVNTARDLKNATVWLATIDKDKDEIVEHLQDSAHKFQQTLGRKLDLRNIPRLYFKLDKSGERAQRIDEILERENDRENGVE